MAMFKGIIGRKLGMTQVFDQKGNVVPVTVIEAGPCSIVQIKTEEKEGYNALQLGFLPKKASRVNKPLLGHFQKAGVGPFYILKEFRVENTEGYSLGQEIRVDVFKPGDYVDVTGWTKGRGFTGVMKRHNYSGAPSSHGTSDYHRHGGSVGSNTDPGRTWKGKGMPGRYGNERVTVQNLLVVDVKPEKNLLLVKGAVPGGVNSILLIREAKKKRG
jgi:large subunit ribosomal protein L3